MDDEDRGILEANLKDSNAVRTMLESKGWNGVIRPGLIERKLQLVDNFKVARTYEDFVCIQQAINAIDNLLALIEVTLAEGKRALEELRSNP